MSNLAEDFRLYLLELSERARTEAKYNPTRFKADLGNLDGQSAVAYVTRLVNRQTASDGYTKLWEKGRLDLSCEAVIRDEPRWRSLFDDETFANAIKRLKSYQF